MQSKIIYVVFVYRCQCASSEVCDVVPGGYEGLLGFERMESTGLDGLHHILAHPYQELRVYNKTR